MINTQHLVKRLNIVLFFVFLIVLSWECSGIAYADEPIDNLVDVSEEVKGLCKSVEKYSIPAQDLPDDAVRTSLKDCKSVDLYYGFEGEPDYMKARKCALINHDDDVLSMIYANGKGVPSDLNVAMHYACRIDAAPAEMEGRVLHLKKMKEDKTAKEPFDMCDDVTSGHMMGWCASIDQSLAETKQKKMLDDLIKNWTSSEHQAFQKLQEASGVYFNARKVNEIDHSGTGAAAFEIVEEMALNKRFITDLKKWNQCKLPGFTAQQFQEVDNQLNQIYTKAFKNQTSEFSTITQDGIKNTEKAWINYRDSWVMFGHIKCPTVPAESWKTLITKERIKELEQLI